MFTWWIDGMRHCKRNGFMVVQECEQLAHKGKIRVLATMCTFKA